MQRLLQFRLGCHGLPIAAGRLAGAGHVDRAYRVRLACNSGAIGDEKHMVLERYCTPQRSSWAEQPQMMVQPLHLLPLAALLLSALFMLHGMLCTACPFAQALTAHRPFDNDGTHNCSWGAGVGIRRACVLVGSQKTLPIAVTVLNGLAPQIGGSVGLAVIPCVVSHLVQIVMDSMLVSQWLKQDANNSSHHDTVLRPKTT